MVDAVMAPIDFNRAANIVELGAGTGPITERLVAGLGSQHRFVAVENDRAFCRILRRRFPQVDVLEADATQLAKPLAERGIDKIDYVVSGLPTPSLPVRSMIRMWQWLRESLTPGGMFVQITVAPLVYRGFYDRLFESVRYRMVWRNVPPGGVYYCSRPRGATNGCSA
jgi:phosphatidylethanolamine/phosphatidyl-N-methylethanolamine N-methyltransferase